jgi:hypothetical protein
LAEIYVARPRHAGIFDFAGSRGVSSPHPQLALWAISIVARFAGSADSFVMITHSFALWAIVIAARVAG